MKPSFVFDAHCDTANVMYMHNTGFFENNGHLDLKRSRSGGLNALIFAVWVNSIFAPHRALNRALRLMNTLENRVFNPGYAVKVTTVEQTLKAAEAEQLAGWIFLEGGHIIENSLEILEYVYNLGVRGMTITHWSNNDWADSSGDSPRWKGLNDLGKQIIRRMNDLGMIIDVSHASDDTVQDILHISDTPIMASHSNARALCDIPRNLPDDLIRQISLQKGFIGVTFFPPFLGSIQQDQMDAAFRLYQDAYDKAAAAAGDDPDAVTQLAMRFMAKVSRNCAPLPFRVVIDHISHIADIGGVDCVGIGSDFDGMPLTPAGLEDVSCLPALAAGLTERGFSKIDIDKIMGGNLLTFLERVEKKQNP